MNSLSPPISFRTEDGSSGRLLAWGLTASRSKQDVSPPRPLLCSNLLELIGLGVFFVGGDGGFLFFLSFLLKSLRWADMETASHLHRAWPSKGELRTR